MDLRLLGFPYLKDITIFSCGTILKCFWRFSLDLFILDLRSIYIFTTYCSWVESPFRTDKNMLPDSFLGFVVLTFKYIV